MAMRRSDLAHAFYGLLILAFARAIEDPTRTTEDFLEDIMSTDVAVKLHSTHEASPPPPPQVDYYTIGEKARQRASSPYQYDMMQVQLTASGAVIAFVIIAMLSFRCWKQRQLNAFLKSLPDASDDNTWLVVAYEWGGNKMQSGRMPLDGISTISELVTAAVEYGAEHVDSEIREENVDVRYMDLQAVERRVGAKTRYADVSQARVLRICRRKLTTIQEEKVGLTFSTRKPASKSAPTASPSEGGEDHEQALEMDDHSIIVPSEMGVATSPV